jgi:hypothetical protein
MNTFRDQDPWLRPWKDRHDLRPYYTRIMEIGDKGTTLTISEILDKIKEDKNKSTYVIGALKKGITKGTIKQIINPDVKTLYMGHSYLFM